jgi:hypothetical protein
MPVTSADALTVVQGLIARCAEAELALSDDKEI